MVDCLKEIMKRQHILAFFFLILCITIGIVIVSDYGESWDDHYYIKYSEDTFKNYEEVFSSSDKFTVIEGEINFNGAFFDLVTYLGVQFAHIFNPDLSIISIIHFINFISFLVSGISVYIISNLFFKTKTAYILSLLFITQPVLWGHAFINHKDMPFMGAFLLSIAFGLYSTKKIPSLLTTFKPGPKEKLLDIFRIEWKTAKKKQRFLIWFIVFLTSIFIILLGKNHLLKWLEKTVHELYLNNAGNSLSTSEVATISNETMLSKLCFKIYSGVGFILFLLWSVRLFPKSWGSLWKENIKTFLINFKTALTCRWIFPTGILIGIATAIRVIGPFAGLLLAVHYHIIYKRKSIILILAIGIVTILTTFVFWPYLWQDPVGHFLISASAMSNYPWRGTVLFNWEYLSSDALPLTYIPILLSIQLTEPVVILFIIGGIIALKKINKKENNWQVWGLIFAWFFDLLILIMIFNPILYDNFRQLLFMLPPIFFLSGLAIEAFVEKMNSKIIQWLFALLLIIPGITNTINLHPYQYIYYNSFVGGVKGSFRRFESDYWATSFQEAVVFLNEHAEENSVIAVLGTYELTNRRAREDLNVVSIEKNVNHPDEVYDFAILQTRWDMDILLYPDAPIIFQVEKEGTILAVVKQIRCTEINPCP